MILTAEEAAEVDRHTIHDLGLPGPVLMETAGRACWQAVRALNPRRLVVAVGPGNNGGDGWVVARYAFEAGLPLVVARLTPKTGGDAALYAGLATRLGVRVIDELPSLEDAVVVDALFGTGLARPLEGKAAEWVQRINGSRRPVVSVDIPSGVHGTSGHVLGEAVRATRTVTFGTLKLGHVLYPGADHCGPVVVADIGFPAQAVRGKASLISPALVADWLPVRSTDANKGSAGRVVTVGGSSHYSGAPVMASEAALRVGAGLSTVGVPRQAWAAVAARVQEVIVAPLPDEGDGYLGACSEAEALELLRPARVAAFGPGLGRQPESLALVASLISQFDGPVVVDADGLRAVKGPLPRGGVITPHVGEMATLMGVSIADVLDAPVHFVREAAARFKTVAVLKGAHTLVADVDGSLYVNPTGNSGMASGGMGDVLTGVVAGLLAQGATPLQAAVCGVWLHGHAGDLAAREVGLRGLTATDVSRRLPAALTQVMTGAVSDPVERI